MSSLQPLPPLTPLELDQTPNSDTKARKRPRKSDRKSPRTNEVKLQATVQFMEDVGLNLLDFLRTLAQDRSEQLYGKYWKQFRSFA